MNDSKSVKLPEIGRTYRFREYIYSKAAELTTIKVFEVVKLGDGRITVGYKKHGLKDHLYLEQFWENAEVEL